MINALLNLFVTFFSTVPFVIVAVHVLVKSGLWNRLSKLLFVFFALSSWVVIGYSLFSSDVLFVYSFDSLVAKIFGVFFLCFAGVIEFLTHKALGPRRVFGSSELSQNKDGLVTQGIYRYARHPRYVEHPMWALGLGLLFGYYGLLLFSAYLMVGFLFVMYFEEKELVKRYGKEYLEYRRKTPVFFIGW